MNNLIFDPRRFSLLLQKELRSGNKKPLLVAGATFGLLLLFSVLMIYSGEGYEGVNFYMFPMVLIGGGLVFTSVSFYEFNDQTGTHHYLSLPASTLEKFLSKWLLTAIFFPIVTVLLFWLYSKLGDAIYYKYLGDTNDRYIPWQINEWWSWFFIKIYLVLQTIYLVGAIAFQKYTFFKTSLTVFLIYGVFTLLGALAFRIIYAEYFDTLFVARDLRIDLSDNGISFIETTFLDILEITFWYILPMVMLVVGFFKLKEKEA